MNKYLYGALIIGAAIVISVGIMTACAAVVTSCMGAW